MIRFSAFLVVVAVGLLVAGVVTSKLLLVYIAIGVSGVALLALGIGAAVNWRELTGKTGSRRTGTAEPGTAEPSDAGTQPRRRRPRQAAVPEPSRAPGLSALRLLPGTRRVRLARHASLSAPRSAPVRSPARHRAAWAHARATPGYPAAGRHARMTCRAAPPAFTPRREPPAAGSGSCATTPFRSRPAADGPRASHVTPAGPEARPAPRRATSPTLADRRTDRPSPRRRPVTTSKPRRRLRRRNRGPSQRHDAASPSPRREPEPVSGADPAAEPELTLVPGATVCRQRSRNPAGRAA